MKLANLISLLAADTTNSTTGVLSAAWKQYVSIINIVMPVLISVVVSFGLVYGIIIGVQFAKAEETEARDKAKQRLINLVIGVVVTAVILAVVYVILGSNWIQNLFKTKSGTIQDPTGSPSSFLPRL